MKDPKHAHALHIGLGTIFMIVLVAGVVLLRHNSTRAYPGMPLDQRAYWTWVTSINENQENAIGAGFDLLLNYPHLESLYLRLAYLCLDEGITDACGMQMARVIPPNARTALYRDYALALLQKSDTPETSLTIYWQVAESHDINPALARLIVDELRSMGADTVLQNIERLWDRHLSRDSTISGAAFGLGYLAVLRNDWERAEKLLRHTITLAPDSPDAYRELGRIYYVTGQTQEYEETLTQGLEAARSTYQIEQELILRGNLGLGLMQKGDIERAEALFREALAQSRMLADEETEGFNLYRLASIRLKQYRYDETLALLDSAEVLYARHAPRQLPEIYVLRGTTLWALYRLSDAERVLEEGLEMANRQENLGARIQAAIALAQLRSRMGRYTAALEIGLEAMRLAQKYRQADSEIAARIVLGGVERVQGHFETAEAHYKAALDLANEKGLYARQRELYTRLGITALNIRDANAAQYYFEKMVEDVRNRENELTLARAYLGLGHTYAQYGNLKESIRLHNLGLAEITQNGIDRNTQANVLLINLLVAKAYNLIKLDSLKEAEQALDEAHRLAGDNPLRLYRIEAARGSLYLKQQRYRQALVHLQNAKGAERRAQLPSIHWRVLHSEALAHWRLGNLVEAERAFLEAVTIAESLREFIRSSESRSYFVQDKVEVYKDFAGFLEEQHRNDEALHYLERARSRSLVDLLYTSQQERKVDSVDVTDQAIEMYRRIRALEEVMYQEPLTLEGDIDITTDETRAAYWERERIRADSIYRDAQLDLASHNRIYTFDPLVADSVKRILFDDEALIVYNLLEDGDQTIGNQKSAVYVVLPDTILTVPVRMEQSTANKVVRFFRDQLNAPVSNADNGWEPASRRLYDELVAPVISVLPGSVRHLHIVPEGVLYYLPFAALESPSGKFLVESYTLSVTPSAGILKLCRERNPGQWRSMLLLADPDGRLPGARREVVEIASQSPNRRLALFGEEATFANLDELANGYDILHFATHGSFVSRMPWHSYLELYDTDLSVADIGQLELDAYLVTLSACETALSGGAFSDVPNGDEWVGMNQAFLAAGTPTVMASLWPISDQISSGFMSAFYESLGPEGKAQALADVQRRFIQDARLSHPSNWAAFLIIGDPL